METMRLDRRARPSPAIRETMMRPSCRGFAPLLSALALLAVAGRAEAHKANSFHTHCAVAGKGVAAEGRTDAERKLACGRLTGALWDESKDLRIDAAATTSTTPTATVPTAPAAAAAGGGW
jgi:hypothetical protein